MESDTHIKGTIGDILNLYAGMAKSADAPDLSSDVLMAWGFKSPCPYSCRYGVIGSISAFQADGVGSSPITCSHGFSGEVVTRG